MTIEPVLIALLGLVAVNLILAVLVGALSVFKRLDRGHAAGRDRSAANWQSSARGMSNTSASNRPGTGARSAEADGLPSPHPEARYVDGVPATRYDRVVRIAGWLFILGTLVAVELSGLWGGTQPAVVLVLAAAGLIVLITHDVLPPERFGVARWIVEGLVGIMLVTVLVILTGREASPFAFAYPLIVAGAALVVSPPVTIVLALLASVDYVAAIGLDRGVAPLAQEGIALVALNIAGTFLLSFVVSSVAGEQRRTRTAAIRLSSVDSLTELFNRAYFFAAVDREIARSSRTGRGFGLLMLDLDDLKTINDRYGHPRGDQVLRVVAQAIMRGVRRIDTAARYGGDEFVVLLPETDPTGAFVLAEKIRREVDAIEVRASGGDIRISLSIGAVAYPEDGLSVDDLLTSADRAMYTAKRQGKNRIAGHDVAKPAGQRSESL